jgi:hypothetical protein
VPMLPSYIPGLAQGLQLLIASLQCVPESELLGLIQKADRASSINAWLIDAAHGIVCQFTAFTPRRRTLESVKRSRKTVAGLRPSFRRRAFHDSMRSTVIAVRGSGYQVLKSRCNFSSVLLAVRGRLALTHVV